MLNKDKLASEIKEGLSSIVTPALKECILNSMPSKSSLAESEAERFAGTFEKLVFEDLSEVLAAAIDYYIKNAQIYGTVITVGNRHTQTAKIDSKSKPVTNGVLPNTLGIK